MSKKLMEVDLKGKFPRRRYLQNKINIIHFAGRKKFGTDFATIGSLNNGYNTYLSSIYKGETLQALKLRSKIYGTLKEVQK